LGLPALLFVVAVTTSLSKDSAPPWNLRSVTLTTGKSLVLQVMAGWPSTNSVPQRTGTYPLISKLAVAASAAVGKDIAADAPVVSRMQKLNRRLRMACPQKIGGDHYRAKVKIIQKGAA
jgi:hypothetical protein